MCYKRSIFFFGFIFFLVGCVHAYQPEVIPFSWDEIEDQYLVRNYTTEDGLPINSINQMVLHKNGYLYIATFDGLVRFDGNRFVTFNTANTPGFKSNRFIFIAQGNNDVLWLIDILGNLYSLKDGQVDNFQDSIATPDATVYYMALDSMGVVWANTNVGLWRQTKETGFKIVEGTDKMGRVLGLDVNQNSEINFLADSGFFSIHNNEIVPRLTVEELKIPPSEVFKIQNFLDGSVWLLGASNQLFYISESNEQFEISLPDVPEFLVLDLVEIDSTKLAFQNSIGTYYIDRETFRISEVPSNEELFIPYRELYSLEGKPIHVSDQQLFIDGEMVLDGVNNISGVTVDREGFIWVGTAGGGLFQITKKKFFTMGEKIAPSLNSAYSIIEGEAGEIWVTGLNENIGISKIDSLSFSNWNYRTNSLSRTIFNMLARNKKGEVLAGAIQGLFKFHEDKWIKETDETVNINAYLDDSRSRIWLGTNLDAIQVLEYENKAFEQLYGERLGKINAIYELSSGQIAFLTGGRGIALLAEDENISFLDKNTGLSSNQIRDIYEASPDTIWVVTEDFGLNRVVFSEQGKVQEVNHITSNNGLIDNSLHRLIDDGLGYFWINSNKGVMRLNEHDLNAYLDQPTPALTVQSFNKDDGLINPEGNGGVQNAGALTSDGKLLFPNQAGIVYTRPEWHLSSNDIELRLPRAESISYHNTFVSIDNQNLLKLPKSVRDFQIQFTLPTFFAPKKLLLEYKLEGVNNEWQRVGVERTAFFTNVSGGEHTFFMRGKLPGDTQYSESSVQVFLPWVYYETWWFKVLLAFGFVITIFLSRWFAVKQASSRQAKLEALVHSRTKELTDRTRELEQSKAEVQLSLEKIRKLDESKSQFFTNFTHELRTPLSLILNPLEDMLEAHDNKIPKRSNRYLSLMKRNADRLKTLINQLLDVSKLNSGEVSLAIEPVQLLDLTKQIISQFEHALEKKNIKLTIEAGTENLSLLYIDRNSWDHICTNLVSNAIKFTPNGGDIFVGIRQTKSHQIITIRDTGIGIESADLPYIFDSYYQGRSSISKAEGTGIGLTLVKGLVERMKGNIEVHSEVNKGTECIIYLKKGHAHFPPNDTISHEYNPVTPMEVKVPYQQLSKESKGQDNPTQNSILLVEDNQDFREYLHQVISQEYNVRVATNGAEGLEVLKSFTPNIILSDIMMPVMDGYEMMHTVRAMEKYKHIPFIFLTAKDSVQDFETGLNSGADIYLTKPVQKKLLLTQVKALLRREQSMHRSGLLVKDEKRSPVVVDVLEIVQRHLGNPDLNIEMIAGALAMSKATLFRKWKQENLGTLNQKITSLRLEEALRLVKEEGLNFSEASYAVGYNNLSYFSQAFKKKYGLSPQEYVRELRFS